jgi:hypothetical protein
MKSFFSPFPRKSELEHSLHVLVHFLKYNSDIKGTFTTICYRCSINEFSYDSISVTNTTFSVHVIHFCYNKKEIKFKTH